MKINVNSSTVAILEKEYINSGELNVHRCEFVFSEEYEGLEKKAVFTNNKHKSYEALIVNDRCDIPLGVLKAPGKVAIGVYGYELDNEEIPILRYSPAATSFFVFEGSYKDDEEIEKEVDTSDANATHNDIKADKTAYVKGVKVTGTFAGESKRVSSTHETQIITPTEGKYIEEVIVEPVEVSLEEKTVTPTTSEQVITPSQGYDGISQVTVEAVTKDIDSDIVASNIKQGVNILGVDGSIVELNAGERWASPSTESQDITPFLPYNAMSVVHISPVTPSIDKNIQAENIKQGVSILGVNGSVIELNAQLKTATPTTEAQVITPDQEYNALSEVKISAVDSSIDRNIISSNIKAGVTILGVEGNVQPDKPDQDKTVNPSTSEQVVTADVGYELASVTVTAIQTEQKTVKSTTSSQTITPTTGKFIDQITVEALDMETKNVTPTTSAQTITPTQGKDGINQINVSAVDNTIDQNIVASNIKAGIEILRSYRYIRPVNRIWSVFRYY